MRSLILFLVFFVNAQAEEKASDFFKCIKPEDCITSLLEKEKLWGNLKSNYEKGVSIWKMAPVIRVNSMKKSGEQKLEKKENTLVPVITIPPNLNPYELVITLNHEILHFLNSHKSLNFLTDNTKINGCLTKYQLELLKDETLAFQEEIYFWTQSPAWFKKHFETDFFESRLLGRKVNYKEYYDQLDKELKKDQHFVVKKYISLGEYPKCAESFF